MSDLLYELDIAVKQRAKRLARRLANSEDVTVIFGSTGLSFDRVSQWYKEKYGRKADRTSWRKMHSAIGPDMNIHAIEITQTDMSDSEGMDRILPTDIPIDRVIADGACCSIERAEALKTPNCTTRRCNTFWIKAALMRSIKNMATGRAR